MSSRSRIEDDVIELSCCGRIAEQLREFVERGDFHGACAGQLLFHAVDGRIGEDAAVRSDDPFPICFRGGFRVDVDEWDFITPAREIDKDACLSGNGYAGRHRIVKFEDRLDVANRPIGR